MGAKCSKVTCCGLWVQRSNLGCCILLGVGSREARLSPINGWQVRDQRLTAYTLLFTFLGWLLQAKCEHVLGDSAAAETSACAALEQNPRDDRCITLLARIKLGQGNRPAAVHVLQDAQQGYRYVRCLATYFHAQRSGHGLCVQALSWSTGAINAVLDK